jgi:protein AaeX
MRVDLDVVGAFVPMLALWFALSLGLFAPVDALLTSRGFYRFFWHPPLARFALFLCLFCGVALVLSVY